MNHDFSQRAASGTLFDVCRSFVAQAIPENELFLKKCRSSGIASTRNSKGNIVWRYAACNTVQCQKMLSFYCASKISFPKQKTRN